MEGDVVCTKIGVVTESLTEEVAVCLTYAGFSNIRQERLSQFSFIILTRHFMYIWYILITGLEVIFHTVHLSSLRTGAL